MSSSSRGTPNSKTASSPSGNKSHSHHSHHHHSSHSHDDHGHDDHEHASLIEDSSNSGNNSNNSKNTSSSTTSPAVDGLVAIALADPLQQLAVAAESGELPKKVTIVKTTRTITFDREERNNLIKLGVMISMVMVFFFVELLVGFFGNSLTLLSDAFHMLSDEISLIIGFVALYVRILYKKNHHTIFYCKHFKLKKKNLKY